MSIERLRASLADRYRIERELGQGGMATVYLAQDLKHDRQVAIKVLRPELAVVIGADRFLSEIKTTANLQHPHILPLFDSGTADSYLFYVMPFIEGESLRDRLTREKQLPIADAVRIATEVASALDYAHRHNIVHRDIKPENILLHDGRALVADFGIALAASKAGGTRMTETGMSLGTPTYMSPEQAMGEREITARSDVYALGCVTYEMLVGEPPFTGPTAQAIVAKVMTAEPPALSAQRKTVPPHVEAAVLTALEKLPADRFASAAEFAATLDGSTAPRLAGMTAATRAMTRSAPRTVRLLTLGLALSVALGLWGWLRPRASAPLPVRRYAVALSGDEGIVLRASGTLAIAPGGERVAYVGRSAAGAEQIWVRDRDQLYARPLAGTADASSLAFSPDGRQLAFIAENPWALKIATLDGGAPVVVSDTLFASGGTTWGRDGFLYSAGSFDGGAGIMRVPVKGGIPVPVTVMDTATHALAHLFPSLLPNGRGLLFSVWYGPTRISASDIAVADLKTGRPRILLPGLRARYVPPGLLVVVRPDGSLLAVRFDQDKMELTGKPVPVLTGIATVAFTSEFDISDGGTLVYYAGAPLDVHEKVRPVWVTREGRMSAIDSGWTFNRPFNGGLSLSPDGHRLALAIAGDRTADIWIKQLDHGPLTRLTTEEFLKYRPVWTPDGHSVTYLVDPGNNNASIYLKRADGGTAPEQLLASNRAVAEALWSGDSHWLVVRTTIPSRDILGYRPGTDSVPVPLVASPKFEERAATLSPDGRFIAYQSDESGRDEIYVRPFPRTEDGRWQLSTAGGEEPLWSHGGREVFYRSPAADMMTVPVTTTPSFSAGAPRVLFPTRAYAKTPGNRAYDVTPDDQRFVMLRLVDDSISRPPAQLVFVDNWFGELRRKLKEP
jgi:Tol biopolymer transport system component/tRNA A-37 threonylcarbamoyl transferase component Bud32